MNHQIISDATLKITRMIWGSMFMSLSIFALIPTLIPSTAQPTPGMLYIIAGVALMDVAMSFAMPWSMFSKPLKERTLPPEKVEATFKSTRVIAFGMSEAVGIFGLVLYFLGEPALVTYLFVALAAVTLTLHFPRQPKLD